MSEVFIQLRELQEIARNSGTLKLLKAIFLDPNSIESQIAQEEIRKRTNRWYSEEKEKENTSNKH